MVGSQSDNQKKDDSRTGAGGWRMVYLITGIDLEKLSVAGSYLSKRLGYKPEKAIHDSAVASLEAAKRFIHDLTKVEGPVQSSEELTEIISKAKGSLVIAAEPCRIKKYLQSVNAAEEIIAGLFSGKVIACGYRLQDKVLEPGQIFAADVP